MKAIVVHGGCDERPISDASKSLRLAGVRRACRAGHAALAAGRDAIAAVEAALHVLEDDPVFDAGIGSFYNLDGKIEMDALLSTSEGRAGGVAAIQDVRHPISVARLVMERTPHILLVGDGATRFARAVGVPSFDVGSDEARRLLESQREKIGSDLGDLLVAYSERRQSLKNTSTVGAVALDEQGVVVAGTSTGGIPQKLPGRIGDSAILGAGTFADRFGGASATGMGEEIIRVGATRALTAAVGRGVDPYLACSELIDRFTQSGNPTGIIFLDDRGREACNHNGYFMPVYAQRAEESSPRRLDRDPTGEAAYLKGIEAGVDALGSQGSASEDDNVG